jgi:hypothetical protein
MSPSVASLCSETKTLSISLPSGSWKSGELSYNVKANPQHLWSTTYPSNIGSTQRVPPIPPCLPRRSVKWETRIQQRYLEWNWMAFRCHISQISGKRDWTDNRYELQPPGLTTLFLYENPESGGDTGYVSQTEAYNRLSPSFREYLETLSVLHSGVAQAEYSRAGNRGGVVKREPVETVHPLVRTHPVTGQKALFINKQFSRRIVGLKVEESEAILNLL